MPLKGSIPRKKKSNAPKQSSSSPGQLGGSCVRGSNDAPFSYTVLMTKGYPYSQACSQPTPPRHVRSPTPTQSPPQLLVQVVSLLYDSSIAQSNSPHRRHPSMRKYRSPTPFLSISFPHPFTIFRFSYTVCIWPHLSSFVSFPISYPRYSLAAPTIYTSAATAPNANLPN